MTPRQPVNRLRRWKPAKSWGLLRKLSTVFALAALLCACAGTQSERSAVLKKLAVGDSVEIVTKHSSRYQFEITELTPDEIIGQSVRVPVDDIKSVKRLPVEPRKPSMLEQVGAAIVGIGLFVLQLFTLFI